MKKMVAGFVLAVVAVVLLAGCDEMDVEAYGGEVEANADYYTDNYNAEVDGLEIDEPDEYDVTIDEDYTDDLDDDSEEGYSFFGVWRLEKIIPAQPLSNIQEGEFGYVNIPNIVRRFEQFLGYELEFSENFTRFGDIKLTNPQYVSFDTDIVHLSYEYANIFQELFGMKVQKFPDAFGNYIGVYWVYLPEIIVIEYPSYPIDFRISMIEGTNPMFIVYDTNIRSFLIRFSIIDDNHILAGGFGNVNAIARRIN